MRKPLVVGVLKETKSQWERRAPLTPKDVRWLIDRHIKVEVESSLYRVFKDKEYRRQGAKIVKHLKEASLILGIKEPAVQSLRRGKVYMVFSHTTKGQLHNRVLLRALLKKGITLLDYEKVLDLSGQRLIYFGRFAGICGCVDSLYYLGQKLRWKGIENPFLALKPAYEYSSLEELKRAVTQIGRKIRDKGFDAAIAPFIVGITGHGRVSQGVEEVLDQLRPIEIHPKDMHRFVRHQRHVHNRVYKIVLNREEKFRSKKHLGFYFEEYLAHPERFTSNLDRYLPYFNLLINGSYWDESYPRLVSKRMVHRLYNKHFRLEFIGDISCDINGSIELTHKATTQEVPAFTYDPIRRKYADGYCQSGITVLAVDNLPAELPKDASVEFGSLIRDYVYQIAAHGKKDIANHMALPRELRDAVVTQGGKLAKTYLNLKRYI